jgi:hypothetical protein
MTSCWSSDRVEFAFFAGVQITNLLLDESKIAKKRREPRVRQKEI